MAPPTDPQEMYEQLASQSQRRQEAQQRDVFLVLAADAALSSGRADDAEKIRRQLVKLSPHTLFLPYASFAEALLAGDIREYVDDLRRQYPPETAARMLEQESQGGLLPSDLFDTPAESGLHFPYLQSSDSFGGGNHETTPEAPKRRSPAASLHVPEPPKQGAADALPAAAPVNNPPPSPPAKTRRRSPYDDADYGPRLPANAKPAKDIVGIWFVNLLIGLVGLLAASVFAYVFIRPFLAIGR